ncbi:SOS response-associated peptidase [Natronosporangium hydrolyticum]|uniref:Abasic site processing protein n=1 Tax=Natronosporangium hydrolyticum TaxID=2811111 RepID=A0A895YDQ0_9ACTN|nr:SOS response-associated peptidase [Natronosporangium hydrolyticum]QSB15691.1 SOS response-associated peptidase [Natronosporangium hydrolyticum]
MCGRYATTRSAAELRTLFAATAEAHRPATREGPAAGQERADGDPADGGPRTAADWPLPRYNVAPTDLAPLIRIDPDAPGRVLSLGRWGLVPHWAKDPRIGARMINARVETVATSRAYAAAFASRRALVPVDGWFEWRRLPGGGKQPYFITPGDGAVLALAGLWSGGEGRRYPLSFTVITTAAAGELQWIHDRMPILLAPDQWASWLAATPSPPPTPSADLVAGLELRPVGPAVGNVRNDGPELLARIDVDNPPAAVEPTLF